MNIDKLLSTKERIKLLSTVAYKRGPIRVNHLAKETALSRALASTYLDLLSREGILKRAKEGFFVMNSIGTRAIRLLLNLNRFDTAIFERHDFVKGAGVYGSLAKGTNTEDSDTDMWVLVQDVKEENLARLTKELRSHFGDVKPLYLTRQKLELLRKKDAMFYHALVFGSVTVYGEELEAV